MLPDRQWIIADKVMLYRIWIQPSNPEREAFILNDQSVPKERAQKILTELQKDFPAIKFSMREAVQ